ncbi:extracellular solute-binding protein, family 3 [Candidatus Moduliflexus flocculans]|uniref:Extracellular solute-binding protein, family 3 n=1 Tax=Candidatus Moduliflexus flocculans TaxID=1499966 RepID=A0A081BNT6_9BACT|nr:extracellular solute-binding protein, family 3 [Candidatus Moduliflexus flocculans]
MRMRRNFGVFAIIIISEVINITSGAFFVDNSFAEIYAFSIRPYIYPDTPLTAISCQRLWEIQFFRIMPGAMKRGNYSMRTRRFFYVCLRLLAWSSAALLCCALIAGELAAEENSPILLVTGEWAPYASEKLEGFGFYTAIVTAVLREMHREPAYKFYPWKRCELLVQKGDAFAAFPYSYTEERAAAYLYSEALANSSIDKLWYDTRRHPEMHIETLEDLRRYKVAGIAGYWFLEYFQQHDIPYHYVDTEELAFRKLVAGSLDIIPLDILVTKELLNRLYPEDIKYFGMLDMPEYKTIPLHLLVSKTYPNAEILLPQFNAAFRKIVKNGVYAQILQQYGVEELSIATSPK